ncbi:MAG: hypothetical protein ACI9LI_000447 [Saprospiraceae bacterium]
MNIKIRYTFLLLILLGNIQFCRTQDFKILGGEDTHSMSFKFINNLIILPMEVNGTELNFILDSGVGSAVVFNLTTSDSLEFKHVEIVKLKGLGAGDAVIALKSKRNRFKIRNLYAINKDLFIINNDKLNLSAKLGLTVHGLIGYDLFKDFIVTINYTSKRITFSDPKTYKYRKCRKCEVFDLDFFKKKPYINGIVSFNEPNNKPKEVKLLIDSGGTDALWLFESDEMEIPKNSFKDFVGEGISGSIYGMRNKLKSFSLKSFVLEKPNITYLDTLSTVIARRHEARDGSLGSGILSRFKVIFDYPNSKITLKKNSRFGNEFRYNMSGIEVVYGGEILVKELQQASFELSSSNSDIITLNYNYKFKFKSIYSVSHIRDNSPASEVGIREGDFLVEINGKKAYNYKLGEIIEKFYGKNNKKVKLLIDRNGERLKFEFRLRKIL